jgi:hypothetical protein
MMGNGHLPLVIKSDKERFGILPCLHWGLHPRAAVSHGFAEFPEVVDDPCPDGGMPLKHLWPVSSTAETPLGPQETAARIARNRTKGLNNLIINIFMFVNILYARLEHWKIPRLATTDPWSDSRIHHSRSSSILFCYPD